MSKFDKLHKAIADRKTILGVGPMSFNAIDAVIEVANEQQIPMKLIASRRQVECKELGGGYVTDTETLAKYVREKDVGNYVFLARDHGSIWQGNDFDESYGKAFDNALASYEADILSGFDILHIDPSLKSRPMSEVLLDVDAFYSYCEDVATIEGREILYEVGTEEHGGGTTNLKDFQSFVHQMQHYPKVKFVVGNTGLYVKELLNIGHIDRKNTRAMAHCCNRVGLYFKGHNTDYISSAGFQLMNEIGVHSMNIAPEYGTFETKLWLDTMESDVLKNKFIDMAVDSGKWKKWMISDRECSNMHKAIIAGHYIFRDFLESVPHTPRNEGLIKTWNSAIKSKLKDKMRRQLDDLGWDLPRVIVRTES